MNKEEDKKDLADRRVTPPRETACDEKKLPWVPAGLETLMDDLKWTYAANGAGRRDDAEQLRNMLFEYFEDPDVYSDGSSTTFAYLAGSKENVIVYEAIKPPHRRCGCENCGCKERRRCEEEEQRRCEEQERRRREESRRDGKVGPSENSELPWW